MSILTVHNPATGSVITDLVCDSAASIATKFDRAKGEQRRFRKSPMRERVECAIRLKSLLLHELESLAQDLTRETGKPVSQSRSEIKAVTSRIDFFAEHAPRALATQTVSAQGAAVEEKVEHEPLGIVGNISAWNYPYFVGLNVLVPALLAGNAVFYKPSEFASITGLNIVRLLHKAGFPENIVIPVIGGASVGEELLSLPLNGLFFTGSYRTGQHILNKVGSRMMRVQLELGGKDAIYVCEDASLEHAIPSIADGAFYNTGQGCCSVERIYVHRSLYERFKQGLVKEVSTFKIGDPGVEETYIGALTRPSHIAFLENQVVNARQNKNEILLGGTRLDRQGSYFAPTIIECFNDCSVLTDESFGPIVAIQSVDDDAHALQKINNSTYGLTAGVYSPNKERASAILSEAEVGSVYWNCCDRVSPYLPWGGRKNSGVGVTLGLEGILSFAQSKAWHLKSLS